MQECYTSQFWNDSQWTESRKCHCFVHFLEKWLGVASFVLGRIVTVAPPAEAATY
jgi:hypothetical protein